jgi:HK97 family phage major capsid protein
MSSELNEDAVVNFASILAMDMANKLGHEEDRVCFNGTGIAGDGGITGLAQYIFGLSGTKANIASLVTAPSFTATPANLTLAIWQSLVAKLPVYAQASAKFYMHKQIFFNYVCDKLVSLGGNNYNALALGAGLQPTLFGYPVQFVQDMPSALTTASINTPIAVLADLSKAVAFGDRRELSIATSTERYFDQDSIAVRAIERLAFSGATDPGNVNAAVASQVPGSAIVLVTNATTA